MALIGSWVPAKSSQIGVVDRIFSRVQSRETCSTNNSSFAIDLNQIALMLRCSTKRSLLLIDEFGKGTNSSDGIALLAATIRSLASRSIHVLFLYKALILDLPCSGRENDCPRTIVATHFSELFTVGGMLKNSRLVSFYTMSVLNPSDELNQAKGKGAVDLADLAGVTPQLSAAAMAEIIFLYRLMPGRTSESHGFRCALSAGVPVEVIDRAKVNSNFFNI